MSTGKLQQELIRTGVSASGPTSPSFKAFLSYSHAADGKLAPAVQRGLHRFARPWYKIRALRVFRDKTSLSANPALWSSIETALKESEFFLLLASPAAASSHWVRQEVAWWVTNRGVSKVLILVTEGDLIWDDRSKDFDWNKTTALPPNLGRQFAEEPLWVDLRWARTEDQLTLRNLQFRAALLDIAAPLYGRAKDDLDGEDVRQHRRALRLAQSAVAALVLLTLAMTIAFFYAVWQRNIAEERRRIAFSRELAASASSRMRTDPELSVLLALEAVSATYSADKTVSPEAEDVLHQAVAASRARLTMSRPGRLLGIAFTVDGLRAAATTDSGEDAVTVWDAASGKKLVTLRGHTDRVNTLGFCRDGKLLATASGDRTARLWDAVTGSNLLTLRGHTESVLAVAFSTDCKRVATAAFDKTSRVWDTATGKVLLTFPAGRIAPGGIAFSPDGKLLAIAGGQGAIAVWSLETGKQVRAFSGEPIDVCNSVAFSPDSKSLATACGTRGARIWDLITGKETLALPGGLDGFEEVVFSPDGKRLVTASFSGGAQLWDLPSGRLLLDLYSQSGAISHVVFSLDGKSLATSALAPTTARLKVWDVSSGQEWLAVPGSTAVFSPDSKRLATGSTEVWEVASGKQLRIRAGTGEAFPALRFTPDGSSLVTGGWSFSECQKCDAVFSPDGKRLATVSYDGKVTIEEFPSGRVLLTFPAYASTLAFSPDNLRLAVVGYDEHLPVVDLTSGRVLLTLNGHKAKVNDATFSSDGRRLATASDDGTAKVWDAASGKELLTLQGHTKGVYGVAFSPDARRLVTTSRDTTAKVWDAASGSELFTLFGHTQLVRGATFSPDGRTLATFGEDGIVQLYAMDIKDLVVTARSRLSRNLTPDECRKYLHTRDCPPIAMDSQR